MKTRVVRVSSTELVEDMVILMVILSVKVYGKSSAENRKKKKLEAA